MSSAASFLPKHSQYNMTQFSTTDRSPGPKPRAESRQSAGDDHNILEQPMAGAELCELGEPSMGDSRTEGRKNTQAQHLPTPGILAITRPWETKSSLQLLLQVGNTV